jgi:putative lipoprotein
MRTLSASALLITAFALSSCSLFAGKEPSQISGTINYNGTLFLTPDAVVEVKLLDISRQDVMATEIASVTIPNPGQTPIPFSLTYDPELIDERMSYSLRADIFDRGRRMFTTDTNYGVITHGASSVADLTLISLQSNPASKPDANLRGTRWKVIAINSNAYKTAEGQREAYIRFRNAENNAEGFAGCNNFSGGFEAEADRIKVGPMAITAMACINGMETEQQFLKALDEMNRYDIRGDTMRLYKDEIVVAHLEAVYL